MVIYTYVHLYMKYTYLYVYECFSLVYKQSCGSCSARGFSELDGKASGVRWDSLTPERRFLRQESGRRVFCHLLRKSLSFFIIV